MRALQLFTLALLATAARADIQIPNYEWLRVFTSPNGEYTVHANQANIYITGPYGTVNFLMWQDNWAINDYGELVSSNEGGAGETTIGYALYYDASGVFDPSSGWFMLGCDDSFADWCTQNVGYTPPVFISDAGLVTAEIPPGTEHAWLLPDMRGVSLGLETYETDTPEPSALVLLATTLLSLLALRLVRRVSRNR
jgi:hypothetical protein